MLQYITIDSIELILHIKDEFIKVIKKFNNFILKSFLF